MTIRRLRNEQRGSMVGSSPLGFGWSDPAAIPPPGMFSMQRAGVAVSAHALALDTPILTADGWKTIDTVAVGDHVYAEDGSPTVVTHTSEVFHRECFSVKFADGAELVATGDHLWRVWDAHGASIARERGTAWKTLSTDDLIATSDRCVSGNQKRYRVRCDAVVDRPEADLPIDPYILGYWLGDGNSHSPQITVGERDLAHLRGQLTDARYRIVSERLKVSEWGSGFDVRFANDAKHMDGIEARLKRLGVHRNKHIPEIYMLASPKQRSALLAGLMDSDGSISHQPIATFCAKHKSFAAQVHQLVRSLGERAYLRQNTDGTWIVKWTPTVDPFRMERKSRRFVPRDRFPGHGRRSDLQSIISIEPVPMVPTRCIAVDHPSHVFLAGSLFTPTHNTSLQVDVVHTALRILSNAVIKMRNPRAHTLGVDEKNRPFKQWVWPQPKILTDTFGRMFQYDGQRRTVVSMALFGEAFWLTLTRDRLGYPSALEVLSPLYVTVDADKATGEDLYYYGTGVNKQLLATEDVTHIPFMAVPGGRRGLSSIEYAGVQYALALAAMEYGQRWFSQGASPSFTLTTDQKLGQEEVQRIAQRFLIEHSGLQSSHLPLVLDSGLKPNKISSTPDEAQFLGTLGYARSVLGAWFGLPSHLLGGEADKGYVWGKTVQEQGFQLIDYALALDTPIPTPIGWTTMGELQPGDSVLGSDGVPTPVISISPVHLNHDCYRVEFDDGTSIVADAGHLWETKTRRCVASKAIDGDKRRGIYTTREVAESLTLHDRSSDYPRFNHRVKVAAPLNLPEADLPIDPYILGYWLGDGASNSAQITVGVEDLPNLLAQVRAAAYHYSEPKPDNGSWRVCVSTAKVVAGRSHDSMTRRLRLLGVLNNKHIPGIYLRASFEQRLALLQGLMDSDGCAVGRCVFDVRCEPLAAGVLELARTLGIRAHFKKGISKFNGVEIGPKYLVGFAPVPGMNVFRLQRKADLYSEIAVRITPRLSGFRSIRSVSPIDSVPVKCITVATEDHLYLAGEAMIPTHNTLSGFVVPLDEAYGSLLPSGMYASLNEKVIQRANSLDAAAEITAIRSTGVMTKNEVRVEMLDLDPVADGDDLESPLNSNTSQAAMDAAASSQDESGGNSGGN